MLTSLLTHGASVAILAEEPVEVVEFQEPSMLTAIFISIFIIVSALFILVSAISMYLAPDAISQINMSGPAIGIGIPWLIFANLIITQSTEGLTPMIILKVIGALFGLWVVNSAASFTMARALHSTQWDLTAPLSGGRGGSKNARVSDREQAETSDY